MSYDEFNIFVYSKSIKDCVTIWVISNQSNYLFVVGKPKQRWVECFGRLPSHLIDFRILYLGRVRIGTGYKTNTAYFDEEFKNCNWAVDTWA